MYKRLRQRKRQNESYKEADKERMDQGDEKSTQTQKKERKLAPFLRLLRDCGWSAHPFLESAWLSGVFSLQHTSRGRSTQLAENTADAD